MNEPYRLRYTNQIVGVFLSVFLMLLIVLSFVIFRESFGGKAQFWVLVDESEIDDLHPGAEILILGEHAGEVGDIEYLEDQRVIRVNLRIERDKRQQIYEDSVIQLERKFGVGAPVLVIRRGMDRDREAKLLEEGSQIQTFQGESDRVDQLSREVASITEAIQAIRRSAEPSLQSVDAASDRFRGTLDRSVDPAFDRTREASESFIETNQLVRQATSNMEAQIESLTKKVEMLLEQDMRQTLGGVRQSSDDISQAAQSVNETSRQVDQDVTQTLEEMRKAIDQVRMLAEETREVVKVVRREVNDLPGTTARFNDTVSDTQEMVSEIRSHWLLRRYSNQSQPSRQISPSAVRGGLAR